MNPRIASPVQEERGKAKRVEREKLWIRSGRKAAGAYKIKKDDPTGQTKRSAGRNKDITKKMEEIGRTKIRVRDRPESDQNRTGEP